MPFRQFTAIVRLSFAQSFRNWQWLVMPPTTPHIASRNLFFSSINGDDIPF